MVLARAYLDFDTWFRLISIVSDMRDKLIFSILYSTGCTESELISIKISDIDFKNNTIRFYDRISKINSQLSKDINEFRLRNQIKGSFLFQNNNSSSLSEKRIQQIVISYSTSILGEKITPKLIRYTHIAHALIKSNSVFSVAKQTGLKLQRIMQISEELGLSEKLGYDYEL